jgi:hypothetical protein
MIGIHAVTMDAADPYEPATWWSEATGLPLGDDDVPGASGHREGRPRP